MYRFFPALPLYEYTLALVPLANAMKVLKSNLTFSLNASFYFLN